MEEAVVGMHRGRAVCSQGTHQTQVWCLWALYSFEVKEENF